MKKLQMQHKDLFHGIANTIAKDKRVVIAVAGTKKEPGFCYTIGNQEKRLPELLLIGNFNQKDTCIILNELSNRMLEAGAYGDGEMVALGGDYPLLIYSANEEAKSKYTIQAGQFYANEDYDVLQVIIPDKKGVYPPVPHVHKAFRVPVLRAKK